MQLQSAHPGELRSSFSWRKASAALLAVGLLGFALSGIATPAQGAVGVEKVSRHAAAPGEGVDLTLACGFCYPPCHGEDGHEDGPCMPGSKAPPVSFPVSLVPIEEAPKPHRCGPNALCSPQVLAPPSRPPYTLLGEATADDGATASAAKPPRYRLHFSAPHLRSGTYTYVIFCDACARGKAGSLIADPRSRPWRLQLR